MSAKERKQPTIKFYQEDIVQLINAPHTYGIVLRCWHDSEDMPQSAAAADPMMRPLKRGEVGVSYFPAGNREILQELELKLVDRTFQRGDFCKRSVDDVLSGVVTSIHVEGHLEHSISKEPVEGWVTMDELQSPTDVEIADYVMYDDWIGQVIESFDESIIEVNTGQLVRLPEFSSRLCVGDKGNDILPPPTNAPSFFAFLIGNQRPSHLDTVVATKHTVLAVCWLAINQSLDPVEAQNRQRPQRFWYGEDLAKLTVVGGRSDHDMRVGERVMFKDHTRPPFTKHGDDNDPSNSLTVRILTVKETRTTINVLWQDCTLEAVDSKELIPYLNPDEYDCWPGDHVIWKGEDSERVAVVQSVNASERTALVLYSDTGEIETASVLELDPHGATDLTAMNSSPHDGFGVRHGEFVFIHPEGATNGYETPRVPRIGELETWVQEPPTDAGGEVCGWRKEMSTIGAHIATSRSPDTPPEGCVRQIPRGSGQVRWVGEVTGLHLNGRAEITHPDMSVAVYPLERLTKLYDGLEQLENELWPEEMSDGQEEYLPNGEEVWDTMDQDGVWQPHSQYDDDDEWEETDEMAVDEPGWADEYQEETTLTMDEQHDQVAQTASESDSAERGTPDGRPLSPDVPKDVSDEIYVGGDMAAIEEDASSEDHDPAMPWKRFDILSSAPHDHTFYGTVPMQPSKAFLARLTREYRVLESSLPESIIVRAYEDRGDLLRSVIIGPENTPYEDAPFVIDWMLDSNFPQTPPIAHFLSWTNGNGRVNPNLYEDGKICLSILGTWAGDRNETWSAARSSLLQAFVSIQGLVLVKEPWFCEPAYEKLRGTEEGIVNSRLYSEKAYVLSRGFVRRALEIPLGSIGSEIQWMYFTNKRLEKVVRDAEALIDKSKSSERPETSQDLAVPRLSGGGIITLERTLNKLKNILESHNREDISY